MIYLAESGSTKCDAVLINDDGSVFEEIKHMGFNPFFHSADLVYSELSKIETIKTHKNQVSQVYFYGAGCSSAYYKEIIASGLRRVFPNAKVYVDHDLVAAAYATYTGNPEIACIIGTGSNSCFFDGKTIYEEVPALAYILGDEGSASWLGKRLIAMYLYKQLPADIAEDFYETYRLTKDDIFRQVYNEPHANVFLAGFSLFVHKHIHLPAFQQMVREGFELFLKTHVLCYKNAKSLEINFVGSVAYHFRQILLEAANSFDLKINNIIQKPLQGLIHYHIHYLNILENSAV
ncbi:MAG: BadF/BadG/BcrA/BcrD ATPase family protein [Thermaurantimonas sp.]